MVMFFSQGTIAIDGFFSMVLPALDHLTKDKGKDNDNDKYI